MKTKSHLLITSLCFSLIALHGCGPEEKADVEVIRPVRVARLLGAGELQRRSLPGSAQANLEVSMSFRVSGPLVQLPVKIGQRIEKNGVIAKIDPRDYELARDTAAATLNTAKAQVDAVKAQIDRVLPARKRSALAVDKQKRLAFEKTKEFFDKNAATKKEFDNAEASYEAAQAAVAEVDAVVKATEAELASAEARADEAKQALDFAELNLKRTTLVSPFSGDVAVKYVENFETVKVGQRIIRLLDDSRVKFVVNVPADLITDAPLVEEVEIRFDAFPEKVFTATVYEISNEASSGTRTYPVTLIMDQPDDVRIRSGMSGEAKASKFSRDPHEVDRQMTIPVSAVFESNDGKQSVWIVDETTSTVKRQDIETGELNPLGIQVKGLETGQTVVTAGVHFLQEGQKVRVLTEEVSK